MSPGLWFCQRPKHVSGLPEMDGCRVRRIGNAVVAVLVRGDQGHRTERPAQGGRIPSRSASASINGDGRAANDGIQHGLADDFRIVVVAVDLNAMVFMAFSRFGAIDSYRRSMRAADLPDSVIF